MNENGNRYALAALKDKRASLASDIVQTERKLRHLRESLVHVDAALHLLDPSVSPDDIPTKRPRKRVKLFRQGELARTIRDAIRIAGKPIPAQAIVSHIIKANGLTEDARAALAPRVRGNLAYLERKGDVRKLGELLEATWGLN